MATIIDQLVVSLKLDASGFDAGQKKMVADLRGAEAQSKRSAMAIDGYGTQAAQFFTKMRNQALALFAVFTAGRGIKDFVSGTVLAASAAGRMAATVGMTTQELTAWQGAVQQAVGGSAEGATSSIQNLTRSFQEMSMTGTSATIPYFRALGVTVANAHGKLRPMSDVLMDVSRSMQGMDPARAMFLGQGLGLDQGMVNLLRQGPGAVSAALAKQRQQGVVTDAQARTLDRLREAFVGLLKSSETLGREILVQVTPRMEQFTRDMERILIAAQKGEGPLGRLASVISALIDRVSVWLGIAEPAVAAGGGGRSDAILARLFRYDPEQAHMYMDREAPYGNGAHPVVPPVPAAPRPGSAEYGVMERVRARLKEKGLTDAQAAGVLANIAAESNFDPLRVGDNGTSFGLFQFHNDRWAALRSRYGYTPTPEQQVDFAWSELNSTEKQALIDLRAARSPEQAGAAFVGFERPKNRAGAITARSNAAHLFMPAPSPGAGLAGAAGAAGTQVTIGNVTVNTQATDARGIARDIGTELRRVTVVPQVAGGLD